MSGLPVNFPYLLCIGSFLRSCLSFLLNFLAFLLNFLAFLLNFLAFLNCSFMSRLYPFCPQNTPGFEPAFFSSRRCPVHTKPTPGRLVTSILVVCQAFLYALSPLPKPFCFLRFCQGFCWTFAGLWGLFIFFGWHFTSTFTVIVIYLLYFIVLMYFFLSTTGFLLRIVPVVPDAYQGIRGAPTAVCYTLKTSKNGVGRMTGFFPLLVVLIPKQIGIRGLRQMMNDADGGDDMVHIPLINESYMDATQLKRKGTLWVSVPNPPVNKPVSQCEGVVVISSSSPRPSSTHSKWACMYSSRSIPSFP